MDGISRVSKRWVRRVAVVTVVGLSGGGLLVLEHVGTGGAAPGSNCHKTHTCPTTTTTVGGTTTTIGGTTTTTKPPKPCHPKPHHPCPSGV